KVEVRQPQMETVAEVVSSHQTSSKESFGTYKPQTNGTGNRFYSPLVLNIAASEGVSMSELENIPGTGNEGRVTKKDILQYVSERKTGSWKSQARARKDVAIIEQRSDSGSHDSQVTAFTGNVE